MRNFFTYVILNFLLSLTLFGNTLENIKQNNVLRAGVYYDFEPFSFIDGKGQISGFDIDMLTYFANELNVDLQIFQITPLDKDNQLLKEEIDIFPSALKNNDKEFISYSKPYIDIKQSFLVRKNSKFLNIHTFSGKTVAYLEESYGPVLKDLIPKLQLKRYYDYTLAIEDLKEGVVDAITENRIWSQTKQEQHKRKLQFTKFHFNDIQYSFALRSKDPELLKTINSLIDRSIQDGTFDKLYEKWLLDK